MTEFGAFSTWADAALRSLFAAFITPGDTMNHRDYGDETDVEDRPQVNQKPIEPIIGVSRADSISRTLEHGVAIGDFRVRDDGSLEPVIPNRGDVNHTWARVLVGELLIATGRDHESAELADFPLRVADLLRDLSRP